MRLIIHCYLAGSAYRECMDNGTWAVKSNYSSCEPILEEKVGVQPVSSAFCLCVWVCVPVLYVAAEKRYRDDKSEKANVAFP